MQFKRNRVELLRRPLQQPGERGVELPVEGGVLGAGPGAVGARAEHLELRGGAVAGVLEGGEPQRAPLLRADRGCICARPTVKI